MRHEELAKLKAEIQVLRLKQSRLPPGGEHDKATPSYLTSCFQADVSLMGQVAKELATLETMERSLRAGLSVTLGQVDPKAQAREARRRQVLETPAPTLFDTTVAPEAQERDQAAEDEAGEHHSGGDVPVRRPKASEYTVLAP